MIHALKTSPIDVLLCLLHCVLLLFGLLIESLNELLIKVIKFIIKWVYTACTLPQLQTKYNKHFHHIELNTLTYIPAKWNTHAHTQHFTTENTKTKHSCLWIPVLVAVYFDFRFSLDSPPLNYPMMHRTTADKGVTEPGLSQ